MHVGPITVGAVDEYRSAKLLLLGRPSQTLLYQFRGWSWAKEESFDDGVQLSRLHTRTLGSTLKTAQRQNPPSSSGHWVRLMKRILSPCVSHVGRQWYGSECNLGSSQVQSRTAGSPGGICRDVRGHPPMYLGRRKSPRRLLSTRSRASPPSERAPLGVGSHQPLSPTAL